VMGWDATSRADWAVWRLWLPARQGGDPLVVGGPPGQVLPRVISSRALGRAHSRPAVAQGDWISYGAGLYPRGFLSPYTSLEFLRNWWNSFALGEFRAATLAVASWVSDRVYWEGRQLSSSPCDKIDCVINDDHALGFSVILSPRWGRLG